MWSTVFETGVSAASISRHQNQANRMLDYVPGALSVRVQSNLL